MALYTLLQEYVFMTQPMLTLSTFLIILQIGFQCISPSVVIVSSVKRRSIMESWMLCALPLVLILTYTIMDVLLGGAFLNGGFHHLDALEQFLHHPQLFVEVGGLLLLSPIFALPVSRCVSIPKWWPMTLASVVSLGMYLICLVGYVQIFFGLPFKENHPVMERLVLWYTYSIFTVLFQLALNITAVIWYILFHERRKKVPLADKLYDDKWCKKQIAHTMMHGHRIFLCTMVPLIALILIAILPEMVQDGFSRSLAAFPLFFGSITMLVIIRMLFPSTIRSVRRVYQWPSGELRRRIFCQEFLIGKTPLHYGEHMALSEHFLLIKAHVNPLLLYLPDIHHIEADPRSQITTAVLKDGERVKLAGLKEADLALIQQLVPAQTQTV